jgi:hypothetical protein
LYKYKTKGSITQAICSFTSSKTKNIGDFYRGTNEFKRGYQPRINVVKDKKGDLVADCHSILARWRNHFSQLLNIHGVNDVRQTEAHTAQPLVPKPSAFEVEMAIEKLKRHKSPGIDQIPAELIEAGGRTIRSEIHKLIISIWNREEFPEEWKESVIVPIYKKGDKTDCSNYRGISLLSTMYKILSNILFSRLTHTQRKLLGIISVDFDVTGQLLITYSEFVKYLKKMGIQ